MTLFGMILTTGDISGGCLNPAIGMVQPIFQSIISSRYTTTPAYLNPADSTANVYSKDTMWCYMLGPLIGGALSGLFHHYNGYVLETLKEAAADDGRKNPKSINHEEGLLDE